MSYIHICMSSTMAYICHQVPNVSTLPSFFLNRSVYPTFYQHLHLTSQPSYTQQVKTWTVCSSSLSMNGNSWLVTLITNPSHFSHFSLSHTSFLNIFLLTPLPKPTSNPFSSLHHLPNPSHHHLSWLQWPPNSCLYHHSCLPSIHLPQSQATHLKMQL